MKAFPGSGAHRPKVVVSLCDYSGNWPKPFHDAGYTVLCYDLKHGDDVTTLTAARIRNDARSEVGGPGRVVGVFMACPCTDFTVSGAQYWPAKDADGRTAQSLAVVDACLALKDALRPVWWMLENPVGRLPKLRPDTLDKPRLYVDPYKYAHLADNVDAERYTKKTGLWGSFDANALKGLAQHNGGPIRTCAQGSWIQKLGGKSERTKELRSMTPVGLARACYAVLSSNT